MLIFFVLIGLKPEGVGLAAALHGDVAGLAFLFGINGCNRGAAKLELCFDAKQRLASGDQRAVERQRYVTGFDELDDFVLFAFVFQVEFVFKFKGSLGVVVGLKLYFVADLGQHTHLDILPEVEVYHISLPHVEGRVVAAVCQNAKGKLGRSLRADVDGVGAKDSFEGLAADINLWDDAVAAGIGAGSSGALTPVVVDRTIQVIFQIIIQRHAIGRPVVEAAHLAPDDVFVGFRIVFGLGGDVGRLFEIERRLCRDIRGVERIVAKGINKIYAVAGERAVGGSHQYHSAFLFRRGVAKADKIKDCKK